MLFLTPYDKLIIQRKLHHRPTPHPPLSRHTSAHTTTTTTTAQPPLGKQGASDVRQSWRRRKQPRLRLARWRRGKGADGWSEGGREEPRRVMEGGSSCCQTYLCFSRCWQRRETIDHGNSDQFDSGLLFLYRHSGDKCSLWLLLHIYLFVHPFYIFIFNCLCTIL